jgi:LPS O-antigen subunit length determinant protein (WzzB/FepE family)
MSVLLYFISLAIWFVVGIVVGAGIRMIREARRNLKAAKEKEGKE